MKKVAVAKSKKKARMMRKTTKKKAMRKKSQQMAPKNQQKMAPVKMVKKLKMMRVRVAAMAPLLMMLSQALQIPKKKRSLGCKLLGKFLNWRLLSFHAKAKALWPIWPTLLLN